MQPSVSILIIEDNRDSRESLCLLMDIWGYKVYAAADGREGVDLALRHSPAVVVSDIGLPFLDGYEVAQRLRTKLGERVVLIALTAYAQPEDCRRAKAAGFDVYLTKPTDPDELHSLLEQFAGRPI